MILKAANAGFILLLLSGCANKLTYTPLDEMSPGGVPENDSLGATIGGVLGATVYGILGADMDSGISLGAELGGGRSQLSPKERRQQFATIEEYLESESQSAQTAFALLKKELSDAILYQSYQEKRITNIRSLTEEDLERFEGFSTQLNDLKESYKHYIGILSKSNNSIRYLDNVILDLSEQLIENEEQIPLIQNYKLSIEEIHSEFQSSAEKLYEVTLSLFEIHTELSEITGSESQIY